MNSGLLPFMDMSMLMVILMEVVFFGFILSVKVAVQLWLRWDKTE